MAELPQLGLGKEALVGQQAYSARQPWPLLRMQRSRSGQRRVSRIVAQHVVVEHAAGSPPARRPKPTWPRSRPPACATICRRKCRERSSRGRRRWSVAGRQIREIGKVFIVIGRLCRASAGPWPIAPSGTPRRSPVAGRRRRRRRRKCSGRNSFNKIKHHFSPNNGYALRIRCGKRRVRPSGPAAPRRTAACSSRSDSIAGCNRKSQSVLAGSSQPKYSKSRNTHCPPRAGGRCGSRNRRGSASAAGGSSAVKAGCALHGGSCSWQSAGATSQAEEVAPARNPRLLRLPRA